jgi:hypothetical protein
VALQYWLKGFKRNPVLHKGIAVDAARGRLEHLQTPNAGLLTT